MKKLMLLAFGLTLFSLAVVASEACGGKAANQTTTLLPDESGPMNTNPTATKVPNVGCYEGSYYC